MVDAVDDPEPVLDGAAGDVVFTRGRLREADEAESQFIFGDVADGNASRGLVCVVFVFAEETCRRMVGAVGDLRPVLTLDTAGDGVSTRAWLREADEAESRFIFGDVADVNTSRGLV